MRPSHLQQDRQQKELSDDILEHELHSSTGAIRKNVTAAAGLTSPCVMSAAITSYPTGKFPILALSGCPCERRVGTASRVANCGLWRRFDGDARKLRQTVLCSAVTT